MRNLQQTWALWRILEAIREEKMRFSLRFLLILIVSAALGVNYWRLVVQERDLQREIIALQQRAEERKPLVDNYSRQKLVYSRFLATHQQQVEEFSQANAAFQAMAERRSVLRVDDPAQFAMVAVPTITEEGEFRQVRRIHVPPDAKLHLMLDYVDGDRRSLTTVQNFEPREPQRWLLPAGESVISLQWSAKEKRGSVQIQGATVFEFFRTQDSQNAEDAGNFNYGGISVERPHTFPLGNPLEVICFSDGVSKESVRLRVGRTQERAEAGQ